ncbi:G patch domain and ankyrin repeat-containing protein 1 homolog [Phlebotomus papatasi]|uniref:G patch domain and ankyrin repeat-containing protein 1 homolog n=1 Tax=Phlebotomus papatasi TaxID=29031 RepID=UPI0024836957|nr:G patch domain and ankyrin repeat-containing protein 1 homolog [Phlebotomus papatasi]
MHPNWRALASVDFKRKIFVRESEASTSKDEGDVDRVWEITATKTGSEAKEFYEEVTQDSQKQISQTIPVRKIEKARRKSEKKPFNQNTFFRAVVNNDRKSVREMDFRDHLEAVDSYGWTALMMASCEGAEETFRLLLEAGASLEACDSHGNTVVNLARKKGHKNILQAIDDMYHPPGGSQDPSDKNSQISPHFCETCSVEFKETSREAHETSTLHKFNTKSAISFQQRFPVPDSNRGCRIMLKQGWNKMDGLGPSGHGRLFPVKTVIRHGRSGIGVTQNAPRVTHFAANDPAAVAGRKRGSRERTRREIQKDFYSEKEREKRFRQQLS